MFLTVSEKKFRKSEIQMCTFLTLPFLSLLRNVQRLRKKACFFIHNLHTNPCFISFPAG